MPERFILGAEDYVILVIALAISAAIGVYFRIFGGKQKTNEEYLFAGKNMAVFPVALSMMATFMSATTLMGIPSEMYLYGTHMAFMNIGFIIGPIVSSLLFLPIYFNTGVSTSYEYLERRFGRTTRRILSAIFLMQNVLFSGLSLYAPALALSVVTNLSVWLSVISIGVVCTFYCTFGGMKAVIWTDVFQSLLMYTCLISIIIKGCMDLGGIEDIFQSAYDGGRIILPTFDMDFSRRYTMWNVFLQGMIINISSFAASQIQVQRQLTLKNHKRAIIANLISAPLVVAFQLLCCVCGFIFYAYFKTCDPLTSPTKSISSADQLMPLYITSVMSQYPGLAGLCIAGIFSASLSTISSSVNSMAAVTYEDIIRPLWPNTERSVFITKAASVFYGVLSIIITYLVASLGNLVKASVLVVGMVSGPTLGLYILAAFTTTTNQVGANIGVIVGFVLGCCLTFIPNERHYPELPVGKNCSDEIMNTSLVHKSFNLDDFVNTNYTVDQLQTIDNFPVSYMWISPLCLVTCVVFGYFGSWITSLVRGKSERISPILLSPVRQWFLKENLTKSEKAVHDNEHLKDFSISKF